MRASDISAGKTIYRNVQGSDRFDPPSGLTSTCARYTLLFNIFTSGDDRK